MDTTQAEQEIRHLIDTWLKATAHGDLEKILDLMDEEVVFLTPGRPPMLGREEFATSFRALPANSRIVGTSDIREIRVCGNHAFVWTQLAVEVTPDGSGEAMKKAGSTLSVFRQGGDGRWRLFRDANLLTQV